MYMGEVFFNKGDDLIFIGEFWSTHPGQVSLNHKKAWRLGKAQGNPQNFDR
jgi:hypothetical protein